MNKKIILLLALSMTLTAATAASVNQLQPINGQTPQSSSTLDTKTVYYPRASIKSATAKYKAGNYTGCLQELFSLTKKDPSNALAYYYMALAYTRVNMQTEAIQAYDKVLALNPNSYLTQYATKGRDCLTGGPTCKPPEEAAAEQDDLDKFINSPYGNGLSPELNNEVKQKQLTNIKETINKKDKLEDKDIQKIKDFDNKKDDLSSLEDNIKIAQVSDDDIINAVKTLKEAGLNLTVQQDNPYAYQDPRVMEMSMLLGNNNNNSNMMNYMPMLLNSAKKGENIDPRFVQSMMMNSMLNDLNFSNNNNQY